MSGESGPRKLSALDATLLVMGGIVGIGIFFNPNAIAQRVSESWAYLSLWGIGGLVALFAAFTFAELAGTFPRVGGWFVFLREAFGPFPAYLFAWVVLFIVSSGAMAAIANFFGSQVHQLVPALVGNVGSTSHAAVSLGAIGVLTAVALTGVKNAATFQNVSMLVKLLAIGMLIVAGLVALLGGGPGEALAGEALERPALWRGMIQALLPVFFSYGGWQLVCYLAPEVRDPERTLPRAIVFGVLGVIAVYLSANIAFVSAFGLDGLARDEGFAATLAKTALGKPGEIALTVAMGVSALGVLTVNVVTAPWLYVAMAREGLFFETVGHVHPGTGVPRNALLLQALFTVVYFQWRSLSTLVDTVVFAEWIFHGLAALALLKLRARSKHLPRPFKSPLYPLAPLVYLACALAIVIGTLVTSPLKQNVIGLATISVGAALYVPWRRHFRRTEA